MTRDADERLNDILEMIAYARSADDRLQRAEAVGDEVGVQIAFESILRTLFIIGEALWAIPTEIVDTLFRGEEVIKSNRACDEAKTGSVSIENRRSFARTSR